ncbi:hypothetical protein L596_013233 [Steinernema carpocapsae]|uniref:Protein kinase domain-containing protein n=3 Tax=Steinernema carpocapsae TaxID=34508 RepID=A0A4V6A531_STECR|nr:hypothetical protein L596_013233 [Steinernema carpocapsae]
MHSLSRDASSERCSSAASTMSTPELVEGSVVNNEWIVERFLNDSVLLVKSKPNPSVFATMIVEPWSRPELEVLRYDIYVLRLMQNSQFVSKIFASGSIPGYNFMITSMHSQNLDALRLSMPSKRFTTGTSLRIALHAMNAMADLHNAGFVHRNVKPSAFCFGASASTRRTLLLTDFSLVRQYVVTPESRTSELRRARERVVFRGCPRYCSVNVHRLHEHSRHDDLTSVLYMAVEMITGALPWDKAAKKGVGAMKNEMTPEKQFENCPVELVDLYKHLMSMSYYESPDYSKFSQGIMKALNAKKIDLEDPYDWEEGGRYFYYKIKAQREQEQMQQAPNNQSMVTAKSQMSTASSDHEIYIPEVSDVNTLGPASNSLKAQI